MPNHRVLTEGIPEGLPDSSIHPAEGPPPEPQEDVKEPNINQEGEQ